MNPWQLQMGRTSSEPDVSLFAHTRSRYTLHQRVRQSHVIENRSLRISGIDVPPASKIQG